MITYKLIPLPNEDDEWLIVSDERAINVNGPYYSEVMKHIGWITEEDFTFLDYGRMLIASTKDLQGFIPLIRKEQIVPVKLFLGSKLVLDYELELYNKQPNAACKESLNILQASRSFIDGYYKHGETYKYTEEDIRKAYQAGSNNGFAMGADISSFTNNLSEDEFVKSLFRKEYIVQLAMDKIPADRAPDGWDVFPTVDLEGYVKIKSIKPL